MRTRICNNTQFGTEKMRQKKLSHHSHKHGFTMVELTLSLSFVSVLLLMVTFLIIHMSAIYTKTLTVKAVNAAGREIVDDMSRRIRASTLVRTDYFCSGTDDGFREACVKDNAYKYIYHQYESQNFKVRGEDLTEPVPTSGTFCTGTYSYIWNSGYVLNSENAGADAFRAKVTYEDNGSTVTKDDFRLIRIYDSGNEVCRQNVNAINYSFKDEPQNAVYNISGSFPTELVDTSESDLAIYDMRIFHPARHVYSEQAFYSGYFILATLQGGININAAGDFCKVPSEVSTEFNYCALNKFNFASQATGETIK